MPKKNEVKNVRGRMISLREWIEFCEKLNRRGNYVWTLLFWNGACIGVRKLLKSG